jgi:formylglycine-generating enzyme required for sulfatase activity
MIRVLSVALLLVALAACGGGAGDSTPDTLADTHPDTQDTSHPDTQDTSHPDTQDTRDSSHPDTLDAADPTPACLPACTPYQLCNEGTGLCEDNPLCTTDFCSGAPGGMERLEQDGQPYYVDRFEWPNVEGVTPEGGLATLEAAAQRCTSVGKRLCTGEELAFACSPTGQAYPYGADYSGEACNTELPFEVAKTGAFPGCHAPDLGVLDLVGNLAEWTAEGKLFGGTVKDGSGATCQTLADIGAFADQTLLGARCCLSPVDDLDEDGAQASLDCNDQDAAVKPGAEETCDGLDNDCDGLTDNAPDSDKDGFNACLDCNDKLASIKPGAKDDVGDTIDADCDGLDGTDTDHDGVASKASGGTDCDDTNPLTFPGAPEKCDGQDNDCDDAVDEELAEGVCDDGNACTQDACDLLAQKCLYTDVVCDDANGCTEDACKAQSGCVNTPRQGICEDGDPCTISDLCVEGQCAGMTKACDDDKPCTADSCDPDNGDCLHDATTGPCDDGDPCSTDDFCQDGQCQQGLGELACDDQNDCTADSCQEGSGCVNTPQAGPCNDQDDCTSGEYCQEGLCTGGANACACTTSDDCWTQNDADWCNGMLYCNTSKTPKVCEVDPTTIMKCLADQDSYCQAKTCDPLDGVCKLKPRNEGQACDNPCTNNPTCQNGQCKGTACSTLNLACAGGLCISNTCTANSKTCDGNFAYLTCNGTGNGWSASTPCGTGKYCDNGDCKPQVCTPDQPSCVARLAGTCNARGGALLPGYTDCQTLPKTPYCAAGLCTTCAPNCEGKDCGDDGCGGSCGSCAEKHECLPSGICVWDIEALGNKWISIPGGTFMMGCSDGDAECTPSELPRHGVTLSSFLILETEVTEGQYQTVTGTNPSSSRIGPKYPVEQATWFEASALCKSIGGRLPTEAEWEYSARGGVATQYYCGSDPKCLNSIAWYSGNSNQVKHEVGQKVPNLFGVYDILGNVLEWCDDWYHASYVNAPVDGSSWVVPVDYRRILRGGSFASWDVSSRMRVSYRTWITEASGTYFNIGIRCAREH